MMGHNILSCLGHYIMILVEFIDITQMPLFIRPQHQTALTYHCEHPDFLIAQELGRSPL